MPRDVQPTPFRQPSVNRHKMVLLTWLGIYPTITVVLWLLLPVLLEYCPLPVMTLVVTGIVVPLMGYVVMPLMTKRFSSWIYAPARRRRAAASVPGPGSARRTPSSKAGA